MQTRSQLRYGPAEASIIRAVERFATSLQGEVAVRGNLQTSDSGRSNSNEQETPFFSGSVSTPPLNDYDCNNTVPLPL